MPSQILSPKRKAIADSSRTMFIWIAAMSAVVGVCVVLVVFLSQQIAYKTKVVGKLADTASIVDKNNKVAEKLVKTVASYEANAALGSAKATDDEKALQVVLDALPADRNPLALGASLQKSLLEGVDGLTVESLSVDSGESGTTAGETIPINIQVTAKDANTLKELLRRLERSVRVIDIDNFVLEKGADTYQATIEAHAYYQPAKTLELKQEVVPVDGGGKKKS